MAILLALKETPTSTPDELEHRVRELLTLGEARMRSQIACSMELRTHRN